MRKFAFILILFLILICGHLHAQDNYLQESAGIEKITRKTGSIKFTVDADGKPKPATDEGKALLHDLVEKIAASPTVTVKTTKTNVSSKKAANRDGSGGEPPPPGGTEQPEGSANERATTTTAQETTEDTKQEIENELKYILFIANTNSAADLKKITATCPKKFYHLDKIIEKIALFNSTSDAATDFAFSETQIIYGLVDFTISRAKEQLIEIYLSKWYDTLNTNTFTSQLLPQTIGTLKAFNDDQSLNVAQYGDKWKAAFQEDLRNFPIMLQKESFVESVLDKTELDNKAKIEVTAVISGGSKLVYDIYLKKHLVNSVSDMSTDYLAQGDTEYPAFKRLIVLSDILLKAGGTLKNNDSYEAVSINDINRMEYASWKIFIKLLFIRHYDGLKYASLGDIDSLLPKLLENEKIDKFAMLYHQTINVVSTYQNAISVGAGVTTTNLNFEETRKLFDLSFRLTEQVVNYLPYITKDTVKTKGVAAFLDTAKPYYTALSQIGEGIANSRYGTVLDGTLGIIRIVDKKDKLSGLTFSLQRYGSFMVNIINAKDADQVKAALDELIPRNLYKLKNTHAFTISLSSYPGILAGLEKISKFPTAQDGIPQTNLPKESSWAFAPAIYLPIGIDFNFGSKVKDKGNKTGRYNSTNLFFQAVDLGAILNYRVTGSSSSEESDPEVKFKQLLSPGVAIIRHFNNSPLVIGAAMSYTPSLRTVNQAGNQYKSNALRFGIFLAVDVTYFNLFTPKKVLNDHP